MRDLPDEETPVFGIGYPSATSRVRGESGNVVKVRLSIQTHPTLIRQPESDLPNYDPEAHFLMMHNDKGKGYMDLRGMSGGPIWEIPQTPTTIWSPSIARLIGVQIAYYSRARLLKATRIQAVIDLLEGWV